MTRSEKLSADLHKRLAHNLGVLRRERGLTFAELGRRSDLHARHLQKIESGQVNVTLETLSGLGQGLDVDPADLLTRPASWSKKSPSKKVR